MLYTKYTIGGTKMDAAQPLRRHGGKPPSIKISPNSTESSSSGCLIPSNTLSCTQDNLVMSKGCLTPICPTRVDWRRWCSWWSASASFQRAAIRLRRQWTKFSGLQYLDEGITLAKLIILLSFPCDQELSNISCKTGLLQRSYCLAFEHLSKLACWRMPYLHKVLAK